MNNLAPICVVVLTFNSERSLKLVIDSCSHLNARFVVVDSYSKDGTVELARNLGCEVLEHPFENYSKQRNWAESVIAPEGGWYLHLDSDEVLSPELRLEIRNVLRTPNPEFDGYLMRRVPFFMGKRVRFGAINPTWHLRLYKVGKGRCEDRLYDQHYVIDGTAGKLKGDLLDLQVTTVEGWTASHNRWSSAEAAEVWSMLSEMDAPKTGVLKPNLLGDIRMRKRWLKNKFWYKLPPLVRPFLFITYSYFFKLGFLDGRAGFAYHVLRDFWFRFLVDAKLLEMKIADKEFAALFENLDQLAKIDPAADKAI